MTAFPFEILTLQKSFLREDVGFVIAPGQEGVFEVLARHAPFVFALKPGALRYRMPDGKVRPVAAGRAFLVVEERRSTVLPRRAVPPQEIDEPRSRRAREPAVHRVAG